MEESCRGWLRVSIALVLESRLYADTSPNWSNIPRHRSSSGYCPWSSPCESAALAAGCFETHVLEAPPVGYGRRQGRPSQR